MQWLRWAQRIQAIAQTGIAYTRDPYDLERYQALQHLAAEIIAEHLHLPQPQVAEILAFETGYPTPKVDIRAVVFHQGRILLVRERGEGRWSLPGGWADIGDSPGEVAAREVREEAGYTVRPAKVLALLDRARHAHPPMFHYVYKVFIRCDLLHGSPTESLETDAVGFFDRSQLPELSVDRVTAAQIARMFEHHDNPDLPADFD